MARLGTEQKLPYAVLKLSYFAVVESLGMLNDKRHDVIIGRHVIGKARSNCENRSHNPELCAVARQADLSDYLFGECPVPQILF